MTDTAEKLELADREGIYVKLRFLATVVGGMGKQLDKGEIDDTDIWAIGMLLHGIAKKIFPEWERKGQYEQR